jgi:NAD(P)-dependent dehydrogenase (short-subunit alcohol dehydrogenase family)
VLAREGADVVLLDLPREIATVPYEVATKEDLDETVAAVERLDHRAVVIEGDVRSQADLDRAVEQGISELGKIDFLVANAAIWSLAPLWEMSEEMFQETIDINLTGVWRSMKAVVPHMIEREQGSIVLISSCAGLVGQERGPHYSSAKHGLIGLMRSAAQELGRHNIRVNAVCPGFIDTKIHEWQGAYDLFAGKPGGGPEDRLGAAKFHGILKGRTVLDPVHVSNAVLWLLSDDAMQVTGLPVVVDAGHLMAPHYNPSPVD